MVFPMDFAQAGCRHMGIDLGGADAGVAEELLDDAQVGSVVKQVGGEAMTQHVRGDVCLLYTSPSPRDS